MSQLGFIHRYVGGQEGKPTLLLLHGTGGSEEDLLPLGRRVVPGAALLSPRGKVTENGMPRFFRRLAEGVFDLEDLRYRASELSRFVEDASKEYGFELSDVTALGYSNGANVAAAVMLLHPQTLAGAILLRPMVPLVPDDKPDLSGRRVLISSGRHDPIVPVDQPLKLAGMFKGSGADVTLRWEDAGHELTSGDVEAAEAFMAAVVPDARIDR